MSQYYTGSVNLYIMSEQMFFFFWMLKYLVGFDFNSISTFSDEQSIS